MANQVLLDKILLEVAYKKSGPANFNTANLDKTLLEVAYKQASPTGFNTASLDKALLQTAYRKSAPAGSVGTDPYFGAVVLLCGFDGTDASTAFVDESAYAHTLTANGNAQIDTAQLKYGTSSALFDGTGDYILSADSLDWCFSSLQFTVECFVRYNTVTDSVYLSQYSNTVSIASWVLQYVGGTGLNFTFYNSSIVQRTLSAAWTPSTGVWYHIAVDRSATGVVRLYIDGVKVANATYTDIVNDSSKELSIGRMDHPTPRYFNGWMDEVRITKGYARYASDAGFTVPTGAFPRFLEPAGGGTTASVTGLQATASVGQVTVQTYDGTVNVIPSGLQATASVGQVTVTTQRNATAAVTGLQAIGRVGNVTVVAIKNAYVPVTGLEAVASVGEVTGIGINTVVLRVPPDRTVWMDAENRSVDAAKEVRDVGVAAESRSISSNAENRILRK